MKYTGQQNKPSNNSMDDQLQPFVDAIKTAPLDDKFQEVVAWSRRVERAEKARARQYGNAYRKPVKLPRLRTVLATAFVLLVIGTIPFEREYIAGRLILMAVEGEKGAAENLFKIHRFPSSQVVYTQQPVKGKTLAILLLPYDTDNKMANLWYKQIELDQQIELRESIEFKDKIRRSLLGRKFIFCFAVFW